MAQPYTLTVPVEYEKDGSTKTRFQRVGVMFRNKRHDTGEEIFNLKLDFPVAVTELVAFPPSAKEGEDNVTE